MSLFVLRHGAQGLHEQVLLAAWECSMLSAQPRKCVLQAGPHTS